MKHRFTQHLSIGWRTHLISAGNCAFVTRKLEILHWWSSFKNLLISGYIIGSPTRDNAQCFTVIPSSKRSALTPGTPAEIQWEGPSYTGHRHRMSLTFFLMMLWFYRANSFLIPKNTTQRPKDRVGLELPNQKNQSVTSFLVLVPVKLHQYKQAKLALLANYLGCRISPFA